MPEISSIYFQVLKEVSFVQIYVQGGAAKREMFASEVINVGFYNLSPFVLVSSSL